MKRLITAVLSISILLCFCGCNNPKESDMEYMVSAIGFEEKQGNLFIYAEIIAVNAQEKNENVNRIILSGKGENIEAALLELHRALAKPLFLNHCSVLLIDDKISKEQLLKVTDFCLYNYDITKSIEVFVTNDVNNLLLVEPVSAIAIGYELPTALSQFEKYTDKKFMNSFFQIKEKLINEKYDIDLPHVKVEKNRYLISDCRFLKS